MLTTNVLLQIWGKRSQHHQIIVLVSKHLKGYIADADNFGLIGDPTTFNALFSTTSCNLKKVIVLKDYILIKNTFL